MSAMRTTLVAWMLMAGAGLAGSAQTATHAPDAAALDASIRTLSRAITVQRDNLHNELLRSLRALADPTLAPFFSRTIEQPDMYVRINGILGLAEVSDAKTLDPLALRRVESELERLQVIDQASVFGLLDAPTINRVLAWDDLEETPRLTLIGELVKAGQALGDSELAHLARLAESDKDTVRGLARMILSHVRDDREPFAAYRSTLTALADRTRSQAIGWLLSDIGRYRLSRLLWWIEELLAEPEIEKSTVLAALAAAIHSDPARGNELLIEHARTNREHVHLVRLGLLLLAMVSEHDIPSESFEVLRDGEGLTEAIADFGVALNGGNDAVAAANALSDLDHWQSSSHLIFAVKKLQRPQQSLILRHLIGRVEKSDYRPDDRVALAIAATPRLLEADPDAVRSMLSGEVALGGRLQEAILTGLLASREPVAQEMARLITRRGPGRAESYALLLIAKHADALTPEEFRDLGVVARGGGRLSPAFEAQAAWLYLKHAGRIDYAMNRLFNRE